MAASASLHSFPASPVTRASYRGNVIVALPSSYRPCGWRNSSTHRVRCMAEDPKLNQQAASSTETPSPSPPPKPVSTKVSTRIFDVLAFSGPGPERINGRLAMVGFVGAMVAEVLRGEDLVAQLADGGVAWFVGTSVVLTLASLVPLLRGVSAESKSEGLMTSDAELWNGRFAMLGLVALLFTEYVKGGALV